MPDAQKVEASLDTVIAILTKTNALAAIAGIAATGIMALFKKNGMPVPEFTPAELNAEMLAAANHVVTHAQDLKAKIREEFGLSSEEELPDEPSQG
jgi:hypothetical protein